VGELRKLKGDRLIKRRHDKFAAMGAYRDS
jgi:hypothetical protein